MAGTPRASQASGQISTAREAVGGFEEALKLRLSALQKGILADYNRHNSYLQSEVQSLRDDFAELQVQMQVQRQLTPPGDTGKAITIPISLPSGDDPATGEDASSSTAPLANDQTLGPKERSSVDTLPTSCQQPAALESPGHQGSGAFAKCGSLELPQLKKTGSMESAPGTRSQRGSTRSNVSFKDELEDPPPASADAHEGRGSLKSSISQTSFLNPPPQTHRGRNSNRSNASSAGPSLRGSLVSNGAAAASPRGSVRSNQQRRSRSEPVWEEKRPSQHQRSWGSNFFRSSRLRNSTTSDAPSLKENGKAGSAMQYFTLKLSKVRGSRRSVETIDGCMHTGQIEHMASNATNDVPSEITEEAEGEEREREHGFAAAKSVEVNLAELQSVCHSDDEKYDPRDIRYSSAEEDQKFVVHPQWVRKQKKHTSTHLTQIEPMQLETGFAMWDDAHGEHGTDEQPWQAWERLLKPVILKPTSPLRMCWDMIGFLFILWDTIMLPLEFFKPKETPFIVAMTWLVRIYWSTDFPLSFLTGYDRPEGTVEIRPGDVARKYLRTWFAFDVAIITFDWLEIAVEGMKGLAALRMGKIGKAVRLLRMVRLLRVLKLNRGVAVPEVVKIIFYKMSSERISIFLGMVRMILFLAGVVHFIACCWYGIGRDGTEPNWVDSYRIGDAEFQYVYMSSFHWALTQFSGSMDIQPFNFGERLFAVSALLFGFIFAAFVVSSITSSMTRLQIVMARQSTQVSMLNHYLWDNGISAKLALRVQRNAMHAAAQDARNTPEEEIELLAMVSEPLQIEMHYEIYCPTLQRHPFFNLYKDKNYPAMRRICHSGTSRVSYFAGDIIFHVGEEPQEPRMYFCLSGQMEYMHCQGHNQSISYGEWLCEYCLWTSWTHCGSLRAQTQLTLVAVDAQEFLEIASQFQTGEFYPFKYAQLFAVALNKIEKPHLTDLHDPRMCLEALARKAFDPTASHLFRRKSRMTRTEQEATNLEMQHQVSDLMAAKTHPDQGTIDLEQRAKDDKGRVIAKITKTLSNLSSMGIVRSNTNMSFRDSHCRSTTRSNRDTTLTSRETTCTVRSTNRWTNVLSADDYFEGDEQSPKVIDTSKSPYGSQGCDRRSQRSSSEPLHGRSTSFDTTPSYSSANPVFQSETLQGTFPTSSADSQVLKEDEAAA